MACSQKHTTAISHCIDAIMADKSSFDENLKFYLTKAEALRHSDNKDTIAYAHKIYSLITTRIRELDNIPKSRAYLGLAKIASRRLRHEDALTWTQKALRCNPNNEYVSMWYAQSPPFTHDTETKISLLLKCLQSNNIIIQARASIGLGNARYTDDTHGKQTDWYLQALDLLEDHPDKSLTAQSLIGLGNATRAEGNNEQAISHYQAVIELQPKEHLIKRASNGIDMARRFIRKAHSSKTDASSSTDSDHTDTILTY